MTEAPLSSNDLHLLFQYLEGLGRVAEAYFKAETLPRLCTQEAHAVNDIKVRVIVLVDACGLVLR